MNHIKRLWWHYLALLLLIATLVFPIFWIYKFFQAKFGPEASLIALTLTIMLVTFLVVRGAVDTHKLVRDLKQDIEKQNGTNQTPDPPKSLLCKLFKVDPSTRKQRKSVEKNPQEAIEFPPLFNLSPNRHRGKPPRFPKEQIRKAVLKWERRDPATTALTLEQFLAQEFGSSPDGILLMATTTFYDWRRRILKEIQSSEHQP